jgi:polyisoprenoid-binding protein YceI
MNSSRRPARAALSGIAGASLAIVAAVSAAAFDVDRDHRSIYFAVAHRDISYVRGRFLKFDATAAFDPAAKTGNVVANVDASSVDTGNRTLDDVLRSPQFLDTAQYPEVRYVGDRFVFDGDRLSAIDGTLWLHGVQQPLRLTVVRFVCKDVQAGIAKRYTCGGAFRAAFDRSAYGLTQWLPDVGDRVELEINVEATRR